MAKNQDILEKPADYSAFDNRIIAAGSDFYNINKNEALPSAFVRRIRVGTPGDVYLYNAKDTLVKFANCYTGEWIDMVISKPIHDNSTAGDFVVDV